VHTGSGCFCAPPDIKIGAQNVSLIAYIWARNNLLKHVLCTCLVKIGPKDIVGPPPLKCRSVHAYEYVNTYNALYDTTKFIHENIDD